VDALQEAGHHAVQVAEALVEAGYHAILIENSGDVPYFKSQVPPETVASLSIIAAAVRETVQVPVGISVLRNDARAALAIAAVTGCDFIRIQVFSGVVATDQGLLESDAAFLVREKERLNTPVAILADVHVQHGITLSNMDIIQAIEEVTFRSLADGVILTGRTSNYLPDLEVLRVASQIAQENQIPLYLGSGVSCDTLEEVRPWVSGVIYSTPKIEEAQKLSHLFQKLSGKKLRTKKGKKTKK
jgi:membrane complex biogenesis BtpA family protein